MKIQIACSVSRNGAVVGIVELYGISADRAFEIIEEYASGKPFQRFVLEADLPLAGEVREVKCVAVNTSEGADAQNEFSYLARMRQMTKESKT